MFHVSFKASEKRIAFLAPVLTSYFLHSSTKIDFDSFPRHTEFVDTVPSSVLEYCTPHFTPNAPKCAAKTDRRDQDAEVRLVRVLFERHVLKITSRAQTCQGKRWMAECVVSWKSVTVSKKSPGFYYCIITVYFWHQSFPLHVSAHGLYRDFDVGPAGTCHIWAKSNKARRIYNIKPINDRNKRSWARKQKQHLALISFTFSQECTRRASHRRSMWKSVA